MRLFQAALDTPLDSPFSATLSVHGLHFTILRAFDLGGAKGTLISEPRFFYPCKMRFFPREKEKTAFAKKNPLQRPFSLSRVGKIASRRGVENRGSLISVPLALREIEGFLSGVLSSELPL